jgi:malonyl CoA-acyl carrier protein transacylase
MGRELFDEINEYASVESQIDETLGYSMRKLCLEGPESRLKQTQYTQPALYVVNALHYYKAVKEGRRAAYVAGHSLGEYNALLAAGVFDFLTGLRIVIKRGELMARATGGAMAAVIGIPAERVERALKDNALANVSVANFNSPQQTVIAGPRQDIERAGPLFEKAGAQLVIPLPVSAAFHSRYVSEAAESFQLYIANIEFKRATIPVIANATAAPYPMEHQPELVRKLLASQITHAVLWTRSIEYLMRSGVTQFKECGPGNVLTKLVEQIQKVRH